MIEFASERYRKQVKALWCEAFEESEVSAQHYFTHCHEDKNMLLDIEDGAVCAMLTMLPLTLHFGAEARPGRYIYAVATRKDCRGQGRSTRLLHAAHDDMRRTGVAASLLVPASESLFDFYAQRGYKKAFCLGETVWEAAALPPAGTGTVQRMETAEDYARLRHAAFGNSRPFAEWDSDMLKRIMTYGRCYGAEFYHICTPEGEAAAFCVREGDTVLVKELAAVGVEPRQAAALLHKRLGAPCYRVRTAAGAKTEEKRLDFAMLCDLQGSLPKLCGAYFNLAMD